MVLTAHGFVAGLPQIAELDNSGVVSSPRIIIGNKTTPQGTPTSPTIITPTGMHSLSATKQQFALGFPPRVFLYPTGMLRVYLIRLIIVTLSDFVIVEIILHSVLRMEDP